MCGGRWALLSRCVCVHVCDLSGCEVQVHIGSVAETAAVCIVRHCRCVVSFACMHDSGAAENKLAAILIIVCH